MKKLLILLCLLTSSVTIAQKTEGVATYVRKEYWLKIANRLTFLSQEQKDREAQTWKNWEEDNKGIKMKLAFNANESLYTYNSDEPEEGGYSYRKSEFVLYNNFEKEHKTDIIEMLGKTYVIDDSLHAPVWKIGNQIKEVAGYICMKAETEDPIKKQKITAWFAQDIPVAAGPEMMNSLPGLILALDINDGDVTVEAISVTFRPLKSDDLKLPKLKGKKIDDEAYKAIIRQHIADRMTSRSSPYGWAGIRY
ncbi:GLPGLI family protein [Spirosoma sp. HMF4905]|uniref:GLPGLI family protein n=1 Tax=Spirosoma arboris TaxID=2682092 RepID=A0A7K1SQ30_9BACT|nr:GLPGLI family protein [Spirosoma arboris]MVM35803.1 GLPGLI family protein [Spirosoma arboris]